MKTVFTIVTMLFLSVGLVYGTAAGQAPPIPSQEQPQVLTRGPVHEAFSEPVNLQFQAGLVVSSPPPDDIDEVPPEERPRGDDYVWIPGYWSWDSDRNNYIWASGCWRAAPPNMSWVPGYWSQENDGYEWVAGFWASSDAQDFEYLPTPPESYDDRPSGRSPSPNDIWVPSCQYWYQDHYVLRSGYWLAANPDWVWTPSHYIWTPRGYIFSDGHWDYPLENRGMLFAPVYFPQSVYSRPRYSYSPSIVLDLGVLTLNLFTYPSYNHYYFGDYYDDSYLSIGIYPRYEVDQRHTWYDPTYEYDRWHHRDDPRWAESQRQEYDVRRTDQNLRPPRTYVEMEARAATNLPAPQRTAIVIAAPLTVVVASKQTSVKFERVDAQAQQKIVTQATAVQKFRTERTRWESIPAPQKADQPIVDRKGTMAPVYDQKKSSPAAENKGQMPSPGERKGQVTQQPMETQAPATPSRDARAIQPKQVDAPSARSRDVGTTQPERVKVPALPIAGKQAASMKSAPPRPVNERNIVKKGEVKDTLKKVKGAAKPRGKGK